jgi:uncharacterized protein YggU (UPF0235/DUF167 family)
MSKLKIKVQVKPNSKKGPLLVKNEDGTFTIFVQEQPIEGKATEAVIKLLSKYLDVPKTRIQLKSGSKSKFKIFEVI